MRRRAAVVGGAVVAAVAVGAGLLAVVTRKDAEPELPTAEGRAFLAAWAEGDGAGVDELAVPGSAASADQARFREELGLVTSTLELGPVVRAGAGATAPVNAAHLVRGLGEWKVQSQLRFTRVGERWLVDWAPSALHPDAEEGDHFERERVRGARAPILGAGGEPLVGLGKVVGVGVQPSRITDRAAVAAALQSQVGFAPERLDRALGARGVKPDHFVPVIELREDRFRQVEGVLRPVPGIIFKRTEARISPAEGFAAHTLGRTGEITAEQLEELGPTYEKGDVVGQSGLELVYESALAGRPSGEVRLVRSTGVRLSLHRFEGTPPAPLETTMKAQVQRAADAALEGVAVPAALVAIEAATGAVLAVASRPLDQPLNRALAGRYPPGSTFKIVTTDALVAKGGADQRLACPPEVEVGGKTFENFEDEALGDTTLRDAFVHSCNTAFVSGAAGLTNEELVAAAGRFGFGVDYRVGLGREHPAVFPSPKDAAERAAAAIGQARVLATPAHMASVLAAATTGTWRSPHLLTLPGDDAIPVATAAPTPAAVEPLKAFLRGVVAEGTGRAAAALADLVGKTGTAEFGSGDPLPTHAWFVGQRAGVAFAVLLEGGGVGGRDAAPVGARFAAVL